MRELEVAGHGVTSLGIAHRLSTVRRADKIVVVAGGTVVEEGTHDELMRLGGVYHGLVSSAEMQGRDSLKDVPAAADGSNGAGDMGAPQQQGLAAAG